MFGTQNSVLSTLRRVWCASISTKYAITLEELQKQRLLLSRQTVSPLSAKAYQSAYR